MSSDRDIYKRLGELRVQVVDGPGTLSPQIRKAALAGAEVPPEAQAYTEKVRLHAYKVTDTDIENLKATDWSEDQIFELTVATALGIGLSRLEKARRALQEAGPG